MRVRWRDLKKRIYVNIKLINSMRNNIKIYIILSVVVFFLGFAYLRYNFIQRASLIQNNEEELLPVFSKFLIG
jgi:hypothetical protein